MLARYFLDIGVLLGIFFAPWWLVAGAVLAGGFIFSTYYEIIFFAVIYDVLYASTTGTVWHTSVYTIYSIIAFVLIRMLRYNFNLHEKKITRQW